VAQGSDKQAATRKSQKF